MKKYLVTFFVLASVFAKAQLPSYIPTNGLVGYWPLDGNANDASGNAHNGIVSGAVLDVDRFGGSNACYKFNGVSDIIKIPTTNVVNIKRTTVSAWVKYTGNNNSQKSYNTYFSFGSNGQHSFGYGYDYNNRNFNLYQKCKTTIFKSQDLFNNWNHVVIVQDSNITLLYLNAIKLDSMFNVNANCYNNSNNLQFGADPNDLQWMTGNMDDIGFWTSALTEKEIKTLYNGFPQNVFDFQINSNIGLESIYFNDYLKLSSDNSLVGFNYSILDLAGKVVETKKIINNECLINTQNIASGMYIFHINKSGFVPTKIIKY